MRKHTVATQSRTVNVLELLLLLFGIRLGQAEVASNRVSIPIAVEPSTQGKLCAACVSGSRELRRGMHLLDAHGVALLKLDELGQVEQRVEE